ncbi:MAG: 50S ribosomal protein L3 N(5)-glutamine methyltransferase [Pseudomonadota bacterium]|nr:50S ribosomal protein L3 N(5)-glutamine methyltransferase [Pseudomonadota bacterium]
MKMKLKKRDRPVIRRLSHSAGSAAARETVGAAIERCSRALRRAGLHFGHGTENARDEAAELVFYAANVDHSEGPAAYDKLLTARRRARIETLLRTRIARRCPLAYLTHRAFFAGLPLYVDERVLVPRSPIAGLIMERFAPWAPRREVRRILDIGTGCGAIALACAKAFPRVRVDAVDISPGALQVCRRNVRRLRLSSRVRVLKSDYFAAVEDRRYDIIVSNPPYVGRKELRGLPREYQHEPVIGLASGIDGLDAVRAILAAARRHLRDDGILVVEVGNTERELLRAFPRLPFIWPAISIGGGGVFILRADDIPAGQPARGTVHGR